jgi:hypothetical protein
MNTPELVRGSGRYALYRLRDLDLTLAGVGVLFPTLEVPGSENFAVASIHVVGEFSTADFSVIVSNDEKPEVARAAVHQDDTNLWGASEAVTNGFSIEHLWVGITIATAESGKRADVYLLMRP